MRVSSYLDESDLEKVGVWGWAREKVLAGPAGQAQQRLAHLSGLTLQGRNWLCLPYRNLVLVHAVKQPLAIPAIHLDEAPIQASKKLGGTSVTLHGSAGVHLKSTGKADVQASWQDPFDDIRKDTFDPDPQPPNPDLLRYNMHVGEIAPAQPLSGSWGLGELVHAIGDTKYHKVTYSLTATTSFREYFPVGTPPQELIRPTLAEAGTTAAKVACQDIDVPNSARPAAPKPLYIVPTFRRTETREGDVVTHWRWGGGLRVYLERPWYSSGDGELLAALVRPENVALGSLEATALLKYTSEWGMDPIWAAARTKPLRASDFSSPIETGSGLSLAERPTAQVEAAGYKPEFDADRKLWYCDVELKTMWYDPVTQRGEGVYFPFVRLALARFQPISVAGAELSPVVLTDPVQVVPDRVVTYDLGLMGSHKLPISIGGPAYESPGRRGSTAPLMGVVLQQREYPKAGETDELGWKALAASFIPRIGGSKEWMQWQQTLDVPQSEPAYSGPLRVLVLEAQVPPGAAGASPETPSTVGSAGSGASGESDEEYMVTARLMLRLPAGTRIVFSDAIEIP